MFVFQEPCTYSCEHLSCSKICGETCDREGCREPCPKLLPCQHPCVGFCGETCPDGCRICTPDKLIDFLELSGEETRLYMPIFILYFINCFDSLNCSMNIQLRTNPTVWTCHRRIQPHRMA